MKNKGFSLIELMVVVAIVGVILAFAIPAYQQQATEARRSDGHTRLMEVQSRMERFAFDNNTYTTDLTDLGYAQASNLPSAEGFYQVTALTCAADPITICYRLRAVPQGGQVGDGNLELHSDGTRVGNW